jgi:cyanophycin synthetase
VGMSCTDGVSVGGRLAYEGDASGPRSAEMVLDDPSVEAAVLETARGGIVRRGLGYDLADVAVITNITADHLGDDGIDDMAELVHVKALVAEQIRAGGSVVLNADDPATAALAEREAVRRRAPVIRFFSTASDNPVIDRHKQAGGLCYEIIDGHLTETEGSQRRPMLSVTELPGAFGGKARHVLANALAAVAACRAAGVSAKDIRRGLVTFTPDDANPGRGNIYRAGTSPVIVDYGHNAAALRSTGEFVSAVWGAEPVAVVTLPGDRREDLLAESAKAIACWFSKVVLYEDSDKRGREPGEMTALIGTALRSARPGISCAEVENPADGLRTALSLADGAPVLFLYEKLAIARDALQAVGAQPWPGASIAQQPGQWPAGAELVASPERAPAPKAAPAPEPDPAPKAGSEPESAPTPTPAAAPQAAVPAPKPGPPSAGHEPSARASADYGVTCGCQPSAPG